MRKLLQNRFPSRVAKYLRRMLSEYIRKKGNVSIDPNKYYLVLYYRGTWLLLSSKGYTSWKEARRRAKAIHNRATHILGSTLEKAGAHAK